MDEQGTFLYCNSLFWSRLQVSESMKQRLMLLLMQILRLFLFYNSCCCTFLTLPVQAFTGTYGINYGRFGDNLPSPKEVVRLLKQSKIRNVRIFDADHSVIQAFGGSGLELVISIPNGNLKDISSSQDHATSWVKENVQSYLPGTRIVGIAIGNEVLGGTDVELFGYLLGAAKNIHTAIKRLNLDEDIQITTSHSQAVFVNSYPPSSSRFSDSVKDYMNPLLEFFKEIDSPFCLNAYPFLAYMYNPEDIDINYALFQSNKGTYDPITDLHYDNMLDAQIDAAYAALESAGFRKMEVVITETGWASHGDSNEKAATAVNARTFNYNLRKRLAMRKGTPLRPKIVVKAYIFALFNENTKPGATSERNFGLFKPDGSISYDIGFQGLKSSSAVAASSHHLFKGIRRRVDIGWFAITFILPAIITLLLLSRLKC